MPEAGISKYEISIIKGMLRMGYPPSQIQAYFTRPDRLVNPARIQEIRKGTHRKAKGIKPANDEKVGDFLDKYAREHPKSKMYAPPKQEEYVSKFKLGTNGQVTIVRTKADLQLGEPETQEIYDELRSKAFEFYQLGHNSLAGIYNDVGRFCEALPADPNETSAVKIFLRGSGLRSKLASYKAARDNPGLYPVVDIDDAVLPLFEDMLGAFGILVNLTPSLAYLEGKGGSAEVFIEQGEALNAIKPAIDNVPQVADEEAATAIEEQLETGIRASEDSYGRTQRSVSYSSIRNFTIALFSPVYHAARYVFKDDNLPSIVKSFRDSIAGELAKDFYGYIKNNIPNIVQYIHVNSDALVLYAQKVVSNNEFKEFIMNIVEIIRNST